MFKGDYAKAAAEFKKLWPGVGEASYGSYSLINNYRDNFTNANKNNNESILEVQFANINNATSGNVTSSFLQNILQHG